MLRQTTEPRSHKLGTVSDVISRYERIVLPRLESHVSRKRTLTDFQKLFGERLIGEMKRDDINDWFANHPDWASLWTRKRALAVVHACFNWAERSRLIVRNPLRGVVEEGEEEPGETMTPEEFDAIIQNSPPEFARFVKGLWFTGARPGELAAATLNDVDWSEGCIKLGKKSAARLIPMVNGLRKLVEDSRELKSSKRLLFPNSRGKQWSNPAICWRIKKVRELGLLGPGTTLYAVRYLFATRAVAAGMPIQVLADLMALDIQATMRFVQHTEGKDHKRKWLEKMFESQAANDASEAD